MQLFFGGASKAAPLFAQFLWQQRKETLPPSRKLFSAASKIFPGESSKEAVPLFAVFEMLQVFVHKQADVTQVAGLWLLSKDWKQENPCRTSCRH